MTYATVLGIAVDSPSATTPTQLPINPYDVRNNPPPPYRAIDAHFSVDTAGYPDLAPVWTRLAVAPGTSEGIAVIDSSLTSSSSRRLVLTASQNPWSSPAHSAPPEHSLAVADRGLISWEECIGRLEEFRTLTSSWDSYDADPISEIAIAGAYDVLNLVRAYATRLPQLVLLPSNAVPIADGGLQLEWFRGDAHLEVEITAAGGFDCLFVIGRNDSRQLLEASGVNLEQVLDLIVIICSAPVRQWTSW